MSTLQPRRVAIFVDAGIYFLAVIVGYFIINSTVACNSRKYIKWDLLLMLDNDDVDDNDGNSFISTCVCMCVH